MLRTTGSRSRRSFLTLAREWSQNCNHKTAQLPRILALQKITPPPTTKDATATSLFQKQLYFTTAARSSVPFPTTPDVCDACIDTIRVVDPDLCFSNYGGKTHFGGQVVTVKCHEDNSMVKHLAKNVDGTGKVIVVDGGGSKRRALLGDMVASDCISSNWEGLVIYGCIRDVEEVAALDQLGVQALGSHPIPTTKRQEGQIDVPVTFGGVTISPGDWIVCDNNGIVVNKADPREIRAKKND